MRPFPFIRVMVFGVVLLAFAGVQAANDARPVVGPGATKDDVINAYGWPNGQSQSGAKEILSYAQGEVILENGRVERVNFSPDIPWQAPKPRPGPATASTRKVPEAPIDFWVPSFDAAVKEAQRRRSRILVLFTGSDWSPASRQFKEEVEFHPDFVNAFAGDFVFLRLDYPRGNPVPVVISEENLRLRDRYQVTTYPTLLILSSTGELLARADLSKVRPGESLRERVIGAVREARAASSAGVPQTARPVDPAPQPAPAAPPSAPEPTEQDAANPLEPTPAAPAMWSAWKLVVSALVIGGAFVLFVLWRMWRPQSRGAGEAARIAERIDAIAGGMPLPKEMEAWRKDKLRAVTAALAEYDSYSVMLRPIGEDVDMELRKRGDVKPRVLVCCAAGAEGSVPTKRIRELFGSLAAEGVDQGWFVSPAGFSSEAREYARAHKILLVGSDGLHAMMREVPPVSLPGVLASGEEKS